MSGAVRHGAGHPNGPASVVAPLRQSSALSVAATHGIVARRDDGKGTGLETALTPEMWTVIGVGATLASIGTGGFTLLWRYIAAAERRAEERDARIEKRAEARSAAIEKRAEARAAELKAEIGALRHELKADVADVKNELKVDVADVKNELKGDVADVKNELKGDIRTIADRMERNHADLRQAIDTLIINDQAKRLSILEEAVLRTGAPSPAAPTS